MATIAVLGAGGVGGFLAAALARAGEPVVVVAGEATAAAIEARGIAVRSVALDCELTARPPALSALREPAETLIVATKSGGLSAALARVQGPVGLVLPLLNGLDHMTLLRERFGAERLAAGAIRIESERVAPGVIVQRSRFLRVDMACDREDVAARLPALAARLERAGVPARIESSEAQALWSKLVRLCALALSTSASGRRLGFIRSDPAWRARLEGCVREAIAVGRAEGAVLDDELTLGELQAAHPELSSSMQRDLEAGHEPELDAIAGAVLRAAARHGLACPTIAELAREVAARAGIPAPA
jgi:2-dehydropantoate 2-reductase